MTLLKETGARRSLDSTAWMGHIRAYVPVGNAAKVRC